MGWAGRGRAAALILVASAAAALTAASPPVEAPAFRLDGRVEQGALVRGAAPAGTVTLALDGAPLPLADDGRFLIGFDRDAPAAARLVARLADGSELALPLAVAPRRWRIERVGMARPAGGPTPEFRRRREAELARIAAARTRTSASGGWAQSFIWPARGRISGLFGSQRIYAGGVPAAYHSGADVAAGAGAPVVAPADGIVTLAPPPAFSLEGNLVIIDHGMGLNSAFLHLASVAVRPGQAVRQGQPIGTVGATGRATGPHLHWSLMWNGARLDPQTVAGAMD